jgi:hypothetical protein
MIDIGCGITKSQSISVQPIIACAHPPRTSNFILHTSTLERVFFLLQLHPGLQPGHLFTSHVTLHGCVLAVLAKAVTKYERPNMRRDARQK